MAFFYALQSGCFEREDREPGMQVSSLAFGGRCLLLAPLLVGGHLVSVLLPKTAGVFFCSPSPREGRELLLEAGVFTIQMYGTCRLICRWTSQYTRCRNDVLLVLGGLQTMLLLLKPILCCLCICTPLPGVAQMQFWYKRDVLLISLVITSMASASPLPPGLPGSWENQT